MLWAFAESPAAAASSLKLVWNQSANTNVVGYKVYYGAASHNYTNVVLLGNVTNTVITGIVAGIPYYFAATTFTASGAESPISTEIIYVAPALNSAAYAPSQFSCQVVGPLGSQYVVEASTDLVNWVELQTNSVPFTFVDTNSSNFSLRFYRTLVSSDPALRGKWFPGGIHSVWINSIRVPRSRNTDVRVGSNILA